MHARFLVIALTVLLGAMADADGASRSINLDDQILPGGMVIGSAPPGSAVSVDGQQLRVSADGHFVFGVGRDAKGTLEVAIKPPVGEAMRKTIAIEKRDYAIQHVNGLPPQKVEPAAIDHARIEAEWIMLNDAKTADSTILGFTDQAVWPVVGPISGVYGSQRILNGKPRAPHRGVDVAAPRGTPVVTMLEGEVMVAAADLFYTGGTVMVDHGHGVKSLYAHLSSVDVEVGQHLARGERLGAIGATGRATGPHLHFSLYWFETVLDPALVLGPMPNTNRAAGTQ